MITLALLAAMAGPAGAVPQDPAARQAFANQQLELGYEHYRAGEFAKAIAAFERAYAASPEPRFLLNIAINYDTMGGQCPQAMAAFERFFRVCDACAQRKAAEAQYAKAKRSCEAAITITSEPAGAAVEIDGQRRGKTPLTVSLVEGPHVIRATLEGQPGQEQPLMVKGGDAQTIALALSAVARTAPAEHGTLLLTNVPRDVKVMLGDRPLAAGPNELTPGEKTLTLSGGRQDGRTVQAAVRPGATTTVDLGAAPALRTSAEVALPAEEETSLWPWIWTGFGVGAAGLVMGATFGALSGSEPEGSPHLVPALMPGRHAHDIGGANEAYAGLEIGPVRDHGPVHEVAQDPEISPDFPRSCQRVRR